MPQNTTEHLQNILLQNKPDIDIYQYQRQYRRLIYMRYVMQFMLVFLLQLIGFNLNAQLQLPAMPFYLGINLVLIFWRGEQVMLPMLIGGAVYKVITNDYSLIALWHIVGGCAVCYLSYKISINQVGTIVPLQNFDEWLKFVGIFALCCIIWLSFFIGYYPLTHLIYYGISLWLGSVIIASAFFIWGAYPIYAIDARSKLQLFAGFSFASLLAITYALSLTSFNIHLFSLLFTGISLSLIAYKFSRAAFCFVLFIFCLVLNLVSLFHQSELNYPQMILEYLCLAVVMVWLMQHPKKPDNDQTSASIT